MIMIQAKDFAQPKPYQIKVSSNFKPSKPLFAGNYLRFSLKPKFQINSINTLK